MVKETSLILYLLLTLTVHPILNRNRKRSYFYYFPIFDTDWEKIIFTYRMKTQMDLDGFVVFDFHSLPYIFDFHFHFPSFLTVTFSTIDKPEA